jgi:peptidoglycan/LPS O-acetylase OafA/YrhL
MVRRRPWPRAPRPNRIRFSDLLSRKTNERLTLVENHFRPEIAGLRAVAVISVVLFHLKVDGFQGGFVGVDIFFVISGYLITRKILLDLQAGRFSLGQFYVRRTRRIYPALIFTVVATYIIGFLWCSPDMFLDLAKESTHAILSISNIQYWRESHQYFAPNSDELALLHCWSLSLEEQFYLFWPLFIGLARKLRRTFEIITIAGVASFVLSIIAARIDPLAAFFLTPFRIFEFAAGALVLLLETKFHLTDAVAGTVSAAGLLCIIASVLLFRSDMPHLDVAILLPCLGAAATIWARDKTWTSKIITNPPMVAVGNISYSLYLCHWPIIFFARFIFGDAANTPTGILAMAALMIAVATAMYFFVERRFIQPSGFRSASFAKNAVGFCSVILPLAAITHATFLSKGFAWRLPEAQTELARLQDFPTTSDMERVEGPFAFQLVGDSHANQYIAGLSPIMKQTNTRFEVLGGAGCPTLYGLTLKAVRREECRLVRDQTLRRLEQTNLPMVYVQKWDFYNDATVDYELGPVEGAPAGEPSYAKLQLAMERTFEKIIANGRRILIIGAQVRASCPINRPRLLQGPLYHAPQPPCPALTRETAEQSTAPINQMLSRIQARFPGRIDLLRPADYFCDAECPVVKDGVWLYFDRTHFTVAGSRYMVARAAGVFRKFLTN